MRTFGLSASLLVSLSGAPLLAACSDAGASPVGEETAATEPPAEVPAPASPPASAATEPDEPRSAPPTSPAPRAAVTLKVLTYNVAGLPQGISSSNPIVNTAQISPRLNPFELVLVQEDFSYHQDLVGAATHPYKTPPMAAPSVTDLGDGLNALSRFPLSELSRTKWSKCNGWFDQSNDCLASKGFARVVVDLGQGLSVDVYDMHFDAGRSEKDAATRDAQVAQLAAAIAASSSGRAVIVAGDTNMNASDEATLQKLLGGAGLTCACRELACPEPERIDRVMFRSSSEVTISAKSWQLDPSFVDAAGEPLSDHEPVSVELEISR